MERKGLQAGATEQEPRRHEDTRVHKEFLKIITVPSVSVVSLCLSWHLSL